LQGKGSRRGAARTQLNETNLGREKANPTLDENQRAHEGKEGDKVPFDIRKIGETEPEEALPRGHDQGEGRGPVRMRKRRLKGSLDL